MAYYGDGYGGQDEVNDLANDYGDSYGYEAEPTAEQYPVAEETVAVSQADAISPELAEQLSKQLVSKMTNGAKAMSNIFSKENTKSRIITLPFKWNHSKGLEPSEVRLDSKTIAKLFGSDIDMSKNTYVHSIDVIKTSNSSLFSLRFEMNEIQRSSVSNYHKMDNTSYAYLISPGENQVNETIFQMKMPSSHDVMAKYGNVNIETEVNKLKPMNNGKLIINSDEFFGQLAIDHQDMLVHEKEPVDGAVSKGTPVEIMGDGAYVVMHPWQANKLTTMYNDQVVSKMPSTRWDEQSNHIVHFDHDPDKKFGDPSYTNVTSEAMKTNIAKSQSVLVTIRLNLMDQTIFERS